MEFFTPEELADILKVGRRTIIKWLQTGKLKGVKLGEGPRASWRVRREDLEQFLIDQQQNA